MTSIAPTDAGFVLAMAAPADGNVNPLVQLIPFVAVLAIFYFIILLPMKRRQKKVQTFLSTLKVGDNVVTSGGLHGTITKIDEATMQIQVAPNVRVKISRNAIVGYQGQEPVAGEAQNR